MLRRVAFRVVGAACVAPVPRRLGTVATVRSQLVKKPQMRMRFARGFAGQVGSSVSTLFHRIETGLLDMASSNEGFKVTRSNDGESLTIDCGAANGAFTLTAKDGKVLVFSPATGYTHSYAFDAANSWWKADDGHILEELLTRELIKMCKGWPTF